jgi:hypothetical protein
MRDQTTEPAASGPPLSDERLSTLQRQTFEYLRLESNPRNGLVADKTETGSPASIAAVGMALSGYPIGVARGFIDRATARELTLATLRFFWNSPQGTQPDATGYKGFYYHFLDMQSGQRAWNCELSTIDSTFLLAGMLTARAYFDADAADEAEIRRLADALYRRVDWNWARNGGATVTHGWSPEHGFIPHRWEGYDEALLLYLLGLGSPTHPLPAESYPAWLSTYAWREIYGCELVYAGPLFIHQFSHIWIDFRGIRDAFMRDKGIDYFENSRRATYAQQRYAVANPLEFEGYSDCCWGFTASDGPGWQTRRIHGRERRFFAYEARGAPDGPDDGTISPWAAVASLPFCPEIVLPVLRRFEDIELRVDHPYGFRASFNPTYLDAPGRKHGWVSPYHFGINQGPIVLMIENYRSELLWRLMRGCPYVVAGLRRAGFTGGWL